MHELACHTHVHNVFTMRMSVYMYIGFVDSFPVAETWQPKLKQRTLRIHHGSRSSQPCEKKLRERERERERERD